MFDDGYLSGRVCELAAAFKGARNWRAYCKDNFITSLINRTRDFDFFYDMLEDQDSRNVFDWIVGYRFLVPILGENYLWENSSPSPLYRIFPGPTQVNEYYSGLMYAEERKNEFPLPHDPYMITLVFILEQYAITGLFEVMPDDVVFDLGGNIGDTGLYFSRKTTNTVYVFEPQPWMQERIRDNISRFSLKNLTLVPYCVGSSRKTMHMNGHVASECKGQNSYEVDMLSLDEFITDNGINKVDLIKMDIEGGERDALLGMRHAIERFRPKLAISIYHGGSFGYDDFYSLPPLIKDLCKEYSFYLRHRNPMLYDSILFCIPK